MNERGKFEGWWQVSGCGVKEAKAWTWSAWKARQTEIDALKESLRGRTEQWQKLLEEIAVLKHERRNLKAENERLRNMLPMTPHQIIGFIGSNFNSMEPTDERGNPTGDLDRVKYYLSVHDLLSAFDDLAHAMADKGE